MHWGWDLWPYALAVIAMAAWMPVAKRRPLYALLAFAAGVAANLAVDQLCLYLVPVDIAGTPPPDPRNVLMRLQITAVIQVFASLIVAGLVALAFRQRFAP